MTKPLAKTPVPARAIALVHTTVRLASVEDAAAICAVVRRSITECCIDDHRGEPRLIESWLRNKTVDNAARWVRTADAHCVVAEQGDVIVGFGMSRGEQILLCYVAPEVRFTGVGKALLQALEAHATALGISSLRLESTRTALAFYQRNGFTATGPAMQAFGLDGIPMVKQR